MSIVGEWAYAKFCAFQTWRVKRWPWVGAVVRIAYHIPAPATNATWTGRIVNVDHKYREIYVCEEIDGMKQYVWCTYKLIREWVGSEVSEDAQGGKL